MKRITFLLAALATLAGVIGLHGARIWTSRCRGRPELWNQNSPRDTATGG